MKLEKTLTICCFIIAILMGAVGSSIYRDNAKSEVRYFQLRSMASGDFTRFNHKPRVEGKKTFYRIGSPSHSFAKSANGIKRQDPVKMQAGGEKIQLASQIFPLTFEPRAGKIHLTPMVKNNGDFPASPAPDILETVLGGIYSGSQLVVEKRAFKNVLRWRPSILKISNDYEHVTPQALLAIIKAETQGLNGGQVSFRNAVGLTQIRYQGAWSFLWEALYSKTVIIDGKRSPDYFNAMLRNRYGDQLKRIERNLRKNGVLVSNRYDSITSMRRGQRQGWKKFKTLVNKKQIPGDYQLSVDISAMYLDYLFFLSKDYVCKLENIKTVINQLPTGNGEQDGFLFHEEFSAPQQKLFSRLSKGSSPSDFFRNVDRLRGRLGHIHLSLKDPKTIYSAYHIGPTAVLEYLESGRPLPDLTREYAARVEQYIHTFNSLENSSKSLAALSPPENEKPSI